MKTALVITSISAPNDVLRTFAAGCQQHGINFILIGDKKSPSDFQIDGCDYWSLAKQLASKYDFARDLPEGHYSRKNLGYLLAMTRGAEIIIETDDDNLPAAGFWEKRCRAHTARRVSTKGWINPYRYFTEEHIWPRGFPLEEVNNPSTAPEKPSNVSAAIQQGLTDGNPDLDAIYRLTRSLPVTFRQDTPLALAPGAKAPFNSQNTTWFKEAFPLLYLPSTCSFRMTDIWRSFVATRICAANGWDILYHSANMFQERNPHNLMTDFSDEIPGYLANYDICRKLDELEIRPGAENIPEGMVKCYELFANDNLIETSELKLIVSWTEAVSRVGMTSL